MQVAKLLWEGGIETEFLYKTKPKSQKQFEAAERLAAPLLLSLVRKNLLKVSSRSKSLVLVKMLTRVLTFLLMRLFLTSRTS